MIGTRTLYVAHLYLGADSPVNRIISHCIMKTSLYNFEPLKPHFYIIKLGFAGVYIIFLISAQTIDCGYSLDKPLRQTIASWKQAYIILTPLNPTFIIILISAQNIDCGYSLKPPRRRGSNEYSQSIFWVEIGKMSEVFNWKFSFLDGKIFSIFE